MVNDIVLMLNTCLARCSDWFVTIFSRAQVIPLYLTMLSVFLCVRFLLIPLVGPGIGSLSGSSDIKSNSKSKEKNSGGSESG